MTARFFTLLLFGALGVIRPAGATVDLDLVHGLAEAGQVRGAGPDGWRVDVSTQYETATQKLTVSGTYHTRQKIDSRTRLAYRIFDAKGELLMREGKRFEWRDDPTGGLMAAFELEIPSVANEPTRESLQVQFDAVLEGSYWYVNEFPEIDFARISISHIPLRDHYQAEWAWIPWYLPADFPTQFPAKFSVDYRDREHSGFRPAMDVTQEDGVTRVTSPRVRLESPFTGEFRGWMPLGRQESGALAVRPGLVWDGLRWYDASDWFSPARVHFVPPLVYTVGVFLVTVLWWWAAWKSRSVRRLSRRHGSRVLLAVVGLWLALNLKISGFWPMAAFLSAVGVWRIRLDRSSRSGTYLMAWAYFAFVEAYWMRMDQHVVARPDALWFSLAVWVILLLPLLLIKRNALREAVALVITFGWVWLTIVAVIYAEFFQDIPSVENLLYAGQIGELGDSVFSLVQGRHLVPVLVWVLGVGLAYGLKNQRKTQIEKT